MGSDCDDPDREAILTRRRRLIAIALSGLTSAAAACGEPEPAIVCLSPPYEPPGEVRDETVPTSPDEAEAMPCLTPALEPIPCLQPMPCLEVATPDDESAGDMDAQDEQEPSATEDEVVRPWPCLQWIPPDRR